MLLLPKSDFTNKDLILMSEMTAEHFTLNVICILHLVTSLDNKFCTPKLMPIPTFLSAAKIHF
jgi:hypothetical protein